MTDKKISQLDSVTLPLDGTEIVPIVQDGETKKALVSDVFNGINFSTELFVYTIGAQEFTPTEAISQVLLVFRNGKQIDEYFYNTDKVTITTALMEDDEVYITYSPELVNVSPFYTKAEVESLISNFTNGIFFGAITPSSTQTGTDDGFWFATENGIYTDFDSVVVNPNSFAIIGRASGVISISQTELDLTTYAKVDNLNTVERNGYEISNNQFRIVPTNINIFGADFLDEKTNETWYYGVTEKIINTISVPLAKANYGAIAFTNGVLVRVAVNGVFILTKEITLTEINDGGFNSWVNTDPVDDVFYNLQLPTFTLKTSDEIYIGLQCLGATDKFGFTFTSDATNEWFERYYVRSTNDIGAYTAPPNPSGAQDFALCIKFGFNDYLLERVFNPTGTISIDSRDTDTFIGATNFVLDALYTDKPQARVAFIGYHNEDSINISTKNKYLKQLILAQQAIADYWGVPILRLDKKLGWIRKNNVDTLVSNVPDYIHPGTDTTYEAIRQITVQCIEFLKQFYDDYTGKKVAWYGTSIPNGFPTYDINTRYPDKAMLELGGTILNKSVVGSTIRLNKFDGSPTIGGISFLDLAQTINYQTGMLDLIGTINEPDLFIFDFGINDFVADSTDFDFDNRLNS